MISFKVSFDLSIQESIDAVQSSSRQSSRVLEDFEADLERESAVTGATASFLLALDAVRESAGTAAASTSFLLPLDGVWARAGGAARTAAFFPALLIGLEALATAFGFFS